MSFAKKRLHLDEDEVSGGVRYVRAIHECRPPAQPLTRSLASGNSAAVSQSVGASAVGGSHLCIGGKLLCGPAAR